MRHDPEIVKVVDGSRLIDCESYERHYHRRNAKALALGYYVVSWPDQAPAARFDEQARFSGPFRSHGQARTALEREAGYQYAYRRSA